MATLKSKIRLCKGINVDKDYINVLNYSEQEMLSLCESQEHLVASADDYSFIRNRGTISTNFKYDDALKSNYIAFQNKDYSNKWFFAWIDEVNFIGEENTEIKYTIDAWSTWYDYWQVKPCFVAREHVNDDTIGANLIEEDLNIGDVIEESIEEIDFSTIGELTNREFYYIIMTTYNPAEGTDGDFVGVNRINKNVFGSKLFAFSGTPVGATYLRNFIIHTNNKSKIESIQGLFIAPAKLIDNIGVTQRVGHVGPRRTGRILLL